MIVPVQLISTSSSVCHLFQWPWKRDTGGIFEVIVTRMPHILETNEIVGTVVDTVTVGVWSLQTSAWSCAFYVCLVQMPIFKWKCAFTMWYDKLIHWNGLDLRIHHIRQKQKALTKHENMTFGDLKLSAEFCISWYFLVYDMNLPNTICLYVYLIVLTSPVRFCFREIALTDCLVVDNQFKLLMPSIKL